MIIIRWLSALQKESVFLCLLPKLNTTGEDMRE